MATDNMYKNLVKFGRVFFRYTSGQTARQTDNRNTSQPYRQQTDKYYNIVSNSDYEKYFNSLLLRYFLQ